MFLQKRENYDELNILEQEKQKNLIKHLLKEKNNKK